MIKQLLDRITAYLSRPRPRIVGECTRCGACCTQLTLVVGGEPIYSLEQFHRLRAQQPVYSMFEPITQAGPAGPLHFRCRHLGADLLCQAYQDRPPLCRRYPTVKMLAHGARLPEGCGYRVEAGDGFQKALRQATGKISRQ